MNRLVAFTAIKYSVSPLHTTDSGGLREDDLYRALRMLVKHGFYTALPVRRGQPVLFKNNAATTILRSDHPHSIRYMVKSLVPQHTFLISSVLHRTDFGQFANGTNHAIAASELAVSFNEFNCQCVFHFKTVMTTQLVLWYLLSKI